jgi:hypothetical protein
MVEVTWQFKRMPIGPANARLEGIDIRHFRIEYSTGFQPPVDLRQNFFGLVEMLEDM